MQRNRGDDRGPAVEEWPGATRAGRDRIGNAMMGMTWQQRHVRARFRSACLGTDRHGSIGQDSLGTQWSGKHRQQRFGAAFLGSDRLGKTRQRSTGPDLRRMAGRGSPVVVRLGLVAQGSTGGARRGHSCSREDSRAQERQQRWAWATTGPSRIRLKRIGSIGVGRVARLRLNWSATNRQHWSAEAVQGSPGSDSNRNGSRRRDWLCGTGL